MNRYLLDKKVLIPIFIIVSSLLIISLLNVINSLNGLNDVVDNNSDLFSSQTDISNKLNEKINSKIEYTESQKMMKKLIGLMDEKLVFDSGSYSQGDIPTGEYGFVTFSNSGKYYSEEDPAGEIIDNENFSSFGYVYVHESGNITNRGCLVKLEVLDRLEVKNIKELYEILNDKNDYIDSGFYKVGSDIEPGIYTLESYGRGYYAILSGPVGNKEIIENDNFNGKTTINIYSGQYLELSRAKIIK